MTAQPPIPPEQRAGGPRRPNIAGSPRERRDAKTGLQSHQPGDADVNFKTQGRQANLRQNLTPRRRVQDR
ncbi:MAG: hypothetical protein ACREEW_15945 [Caulobacteraceae bacterium]